MTPEQQDRMAKLEELAEAAARFFPYAWHATGGHDVVEAKWAVKRALQALGMY